MLKNISKEFHPSSNEKSQPNNDNNKADVSSSPSSGTIDTHVDGFVTLNNPLFEEEYEVRSAFASTPNQNNNNNKNPLYMLFPRSKNDDSSGKKMLNSYHWKKSELWHKMVMIISSLLHL